MQVSKKQKKFSELFSEADDGHHILYISKFTECERSG